MFPAIKKRKMRKRETKDRKEEKQGKFNFSSYMLIWKLLLVTPKLAGGGGRFRVSSRSSENSSEGWGDGVRGLFVYIITFSLR